MRLSVWIFATFSSLTAASASADEFAVARDAIEQGNYVAAVATLESLAEKDDAGSLALLASLYQTSQGVPKDIERAIEFYKRAAELGHPEAQFNLGNIYLLGEGVKADEAWALTYYRQAASQGHELAARNMSQLYRAAGLEPPTFPAAATATPAPEDLARQEAEPGLRASHPRQRRHRKFPPMRSRPSDWRRHTGLKSVSILMMPWFDQGARSTPMGRPWRMP